MQPHTKPEGIEVQVAVPAPAEGHAVHDVPHELTELSGRHAAPQRWKPELQVKSQALPLHTGDALAGVVHAAHAVPQRRKPALQVKPHWLPLQVDAAFATVGQTMHVAPQLVSAVLGAQLWPQTCSPLAQEQLPLLVLHVAPDGHSEFSLQPSEQSLETASQP